jgi:hypothetical protein
MSKVLQDVTYAAEAAVAAAGLGLTNFRPI